MSIPWNLGLTIAVGIWLMFTRPTIGASGGMANADHLIGALVVTVTVTALADVARPASFLNMGFGAALIVTAFAYGATWSGIASGIVCGLALIALSAPRGTIHNRYGRCTKFIV